MITKRTRQLQENKQDLREKSQAEFENAEQLQDKLDLSEPPEQDDGIAKRENKLQSSTSPWHAWIR